MKLSIFMTAIILAMVGLIAGLSAWAASVSNAPVLTRTNCKVLTQGSGVNCAVVP